MTLLFRGDYLHRRRFITRDLVPFVVLTADRDYCSGQVHKYHLIIYKGCVKLLSK